MPGRKRAAPATESKDTKAPVAKRRSTRVLAQGISPPTLYTGTPSEQDTQSARAKRGRQESKAGSAASDETHQNAESKGASREVSASKREPEPKAKATGNGVPTAVSSRDGAWRTTRH